MITKLAPVSDFL